MCPQILKLYFISYANQQPVQCLMQRAALHYAKPLGKQNDVTRMVLMEQLPKSSKKTASIILRSG